VQPVKTDTNPQVPEQPNVPSESEETPDVYDEISALLQGKTDTEENTATPPSSETPEITEPTERPETPETPETPEIPETPETPPTEPTDNLQDKIKIADKEFVKVEIEKGVFGYVPEDVKAGVLMQADYTRKTQALQEEKQSVEEMRKRVSDAYEKLRNEVELQMLGESIDKPIESDYIDVYASDEERAGQKKQYQKDLRTWEEYQSKKTQFSANVQNASAVNEKTAEAFIKKYGAKELEELVPVIQEYVEPFKSYGSVPFKEDTLELFYKARNFDKILKEEINKAKEQWLKEIGGKKKSEPKEIDVNYPSKPKTSGDIYDNVSEALRRSSGY